MAWFSISFAVVLSGGTAAEQLQQIHAMNVSAACVWIVVLRIAVLTQLNGSSVMWKMNLGGISSAGTFRYRIDRCPPVQRE